MSGDISNIRPPEIFTQGYKFRVSVLIQEQIYEAIPEQIQEVIPEVILDPVQEAIHEVIHFL
jgi:hypothetical protein